MCMLDQFMIWNILEVQRQLDEDSQNSSDGDAAAGPSDGVEDPESILTKKAQGQIFPGTSRFAGKFQINV